MAEALTATPKLKNILTPRFVGCYVTLAKPRAMEPGKDPEYSIAMLFDRNADLTHIRQAIEDAAKTKFGANAPVLLGTRLKTPLKDGNLKMDDDGIIDPIYKDKWVINARSKTRVTVIDPNKNIIDPNELFSGNIFHAQLRFYPYEYTAPGQKAAMSRGVGCGLQNLMRIGLGKRIDGRQDAITAFRDFVPDEVENTDDLDDLFG